MAAKTLPTVVRGGEYYRVCKPDWVDCGDTAYSKICGRWNPKGAFGALYLNASLRVAAAQARHQHAGRAIGLFDLRADRRPLLAIIDVPTIAVLDVVNAVSIGALGLPRSFPIDVPWEPCQRIAHRAYRSAIAGVASLSNAEARRDYIVGEELAYFDSQPVLQIRTQRTFQEWYQDPSPRE